MADFRELFTSSDFAAYQERVVDEVVGWAAAMLYDVNGINKNELRGGIDMARRILELPGNIVNDGPLAKRISAQVSARLMSIPAQLLRKELVGEQH